MSYLRNIIAYLITLALAWILVAALGFSSETVSPYLWFGSWSAFCVFVYPLCLYGWFEFLRPRQWWIWPLGTLLAFPIGVAIKAAELHYPAQSNKIALNCLILPILPYLLLTKWRFLCFLYRALRARLETK
jgi:hypothetical protein